MHTDFATRLLAWQRQHGRNDLPWQLDHDPYRVWLSEIMLQQTQVDTVIPYYRRFLARFPDLAALAAAPLDEVLALWSGLGYYARARNLHRAAQLLVADHGGAFPHTPQAIAELPGIGRSTAASIAAFCFGARAAILDGNVKRVLARHAGIAGWPGERAVEQALWQEAQARVPVEAGRYNQGLMDLGALVCLRRRPRCDACPVAQDCVARREARQAELPAARPRRPLPEREVTVLLLQAGELWLLERRPPSGIWGGLYGLPEAAAGESAASATLRRFGIAVTDWQALTPLRHVFTHFALTLHPWHARLAAPPQVLHDPALHWHAHTQWPQLGLPTPVRKLLEATTAANAAG